MQNRIVNYISKNKVFVIFILFILLYHIKFITVLNKIFCFSEMCSGENIKNFRTGWDFYPLLDVISSREPSSYIPYGLVTYPIINLFSLIGRPWDIYVYYWFVTIGILLFNFYFFIYQSWKDTSLIEKIQNTIVSIVFPFATFGYGMFARSLNSEGIVILLVLMGYMLYTKKYNVLSMIFFSMAIAMKYYPGLFLLLFIKDKQYKYFFYGCLVPIILTLLTSMFYFDGGLRPVITSIRVLLENSSTCSDHLPLCSIHNQSLVHLLQYFTDSKAIHHIMTLIFGICGVLCILLTKSTFKALFMTCILIFLLPQISFAYKIPLIMVAFYALTRENLQIYDLFPYLIILTFTIGMNDHGYNIPFTWHKISFHDQYAYNMSTHYVISYFYIIYSIIMEKMNIRGYQLVK